MVAEPTMVTDTGITPLKMPTHLRNRDILHTAIITMPIIMLTSLLQHHRNTPTTASNMPRHPDPTVPVTGIRDGQKSCGLQMHRDASRVQIFF